jgi:hypothetical protein
MRGMLATVCRALPARRAGGAARRGGARPAARPAAAAAPPAPRPAPQPGRAPRRFAPPAGRALATPAGAAEAPAAPARAPGAAKPPTFQQAIQRLQDFWASVGCAVYLPHNTEVGAGTMNPATFLRVLGPEPWSVAYAEPSIRPDDSRYGDNPNRVQRHTQFQARARVRDSRAAARGAGARAAHARAAAAPRRLRTTSPRAALSAAHALRAAAAFAGNPQAGARQRAGAVPAQPGRAGHRHRRARRPFRRR